MILLVRRGPTVFKYIYIFIFAWYIRVGRDLSKPRAAWV